MASSEANFSPIGCDSVTHQQCLALEPEDLGMVDPSASALDVLQHRAHFTCIAHMI